STAPETIAVVAWSSGLGWSTKAGRKSCAVTSAATTTTRRTNSNLTRAQTTRPGCRAGLAQRLGPDADQPLESDTEGRNERHDHRGEEAARHPPAGDAERGGNRRVDDREHERHEQDPDAPGRWVHRGHHGVAGRGGRDRAEEPEDVGRVEAGETLLRV